MQSIKIKIKGINQMALTKYEQETLILINPADEAVTIYTANKANKNKCIRLGFEQEKAPDRDRSGKEIAWHFRISREDFSWGRKKRMKKLSDSKRKELAERLKKNRLNGQKP